MNKRYLRTAGTLVGAGAVLCLSTGSAIQAQQEETYAAPRTAWGDPDFQGSWENRSPTPLQRDPQYGTREFLTEEEAAQRAAARGGLPDGEESAIADDLAAADVQRYARADNADPDLPGRSLSGAAYNSFWNAPVSERLAARRTSQIVDPPNGRLPPYTRAKSSKSGRNARRRGRIGARPIRGWTGTSWSAVSSGPAWPWAR